VVLHRHFPAVRETPDFKGLLRCRISVAERESFAPRGGEAFSKYRLPLAAAWTCGSRDPTRDEMLKMIQAALAGYALDA